MYSSAPDNPRRWKPRAVADGEISRRDHLAALAPPAGGLRMRLLEELFSAGRVDLLMTGIGAVNAQEFPSGEHVALVCGEERAVLGLSEGLARELVDRGMRRIPTLEAAALTSGEEGALLLVLDRAGGDWTERGGRRFELRGLLHDGRQAAAYLGTGDLFRVSGRLVIDGEARDIWVVTGVPDEAAGVSRFEPDRGRAASWPVVYRIVVGRSVIPLDDVGSLSMGDLLTLDRWCHPGCAADAADDILECGGDVLGARWVDRHRLELVSRGFKRTAMDTRDIEMKAALDRRPGDASGQMEVRVKALAGEVTLSVDDALALVPGRILSLDRPVGGEVSLVVGDRLIARGELVAHEGRMAVEITEVT